MLQSASAEIALTTAPRRSFVVTQNPRGQWIARETHGLIEGVFLSQREAIRFALFEAGNRTSIVVVGPSPAPHH